jgi:hypothetical protein
MNEAKGRLSSEIEGLKEARKTLRERHKEAKKFRTEHSDIKCDVTELRISQLRTSRPKTVQFKIA